MFLVLTERMPQRVDGTLPRFDEATAIYLFRQMLDAVEYIHNNGVAHLDISLENILLLSNTNHITLIDFGMCRRIPRDADGNVIEFPAGSMRPTNKVFYIDPNIYAGVAFDAVKADIWSLVTTLFIVLTGFPAYEQPIGTDARFRAMEEGRFMELVREWHLETYLSENCINFLNFCFVVNHRARPTIELIRAQPWLQL
jgi:serine/threonine protein kinase